MQIVMTIVSQILCSSGLNFRMDRIRSAFGGNPPWTSSDDSDVAPLTELVTTENSSLCPSMSLQNRLICFGVCTGVGIMLSIGGSINMFFHNYQGIFVLLLSFLNVILGFAVLYSMGTIISLIGSGFLRGPVKQIKALTDTSRLVAVLVMLFSIVITIVAAVVWKNGILSLVFCIFQFFSYMWYCLSYIPYGRDAVTGCFKSCV